MTDDAPADPMRQAVDRYLDGLERRDEFFTEQREQSRARRKRAWQTAKAATGAIVVQAFGTVLGGLLLGAIAAATGLIQSDLPAWLFAVLFIVGLVVLTALVYPPSLIDREVRTSFELPHVNDLINELAETRMKEREGGDESVVEPEEAPPSGA